MTEKVKITAKRFSNRREFLKATAAIAAGSMCDVVLPVEPEPVMRESRVILDEGLHWIGKKRAARVCKRVKQAGFNVLMPCVWHGRGTSWSSEIAPWDDRLDGRRHHDSVDTLIQVAKEYELEVHPWFTIGLRHRDIYTEFAVNPKGRGFDFHNHAFREFISSLVQEFVERYPVDGVNLDFVRFTAPRPGKEIAQEIAVSSVVRQISMGIKKVNPKLVVSVDAAPINPKIKQFGQDSVKWAEQGVVDVVYSMQYQSTPDFDSIKAVMALMKRPESMVVMLGNFERDKETRKVVARDPHLTNKLVAESRKVSRGNGVALYYYGMLTDSQIQVLSSGAFKRPAVPDWKRANT